jgi:hypothetical protein
MRKLTKATIAFKIERDNQEFQEIIAADVERACTELLKSESLTDGHEDIRIGF